MVPVDARTRYSIANGENGPPGGPEKAMLLDDVTINDGGDCPNSVAGRPSKAIETSRPVAMMLERRAPPRGGHLRLKAIFTWYVYCLASRRFSGS
jgi:hypothetical protein